MKTFILFLMLTLQTPPGQNVIVGLADGQRLVVENPEFAGFIEGRNGDAVLMYRQANFHGEMPMKVVSKIEFGEYKKGGPIAMTVTLRNGQELDVVAERRDHVALKGKTEFGTVTIKHPDPLSSPIGINSKKANRKKDLTIRYLEFPAP